MLYTNKRERGKTIPASSVQVLPGRNLLVGANFPSPKIRTLFWLRIWKMLLCRPKTKSFRRWPNLIYLKNPLHTDAAMWYDMANQKTILDRAQIPVEGQRGTTMIDFSKLTWSILVNVPAAASQIFSGFGESRGGKNLSLLNPQSRIERCFVYHYKKEAIKKCR